MSISRTLNDKTDEAMKAADTLRHQASMKMQSDVLTALDCNKEEMNRVLMIMARNGWTKHEKFVAVGSVRVFDLKLEIRWFKTVWMEIGPNTVPRSVEMSWNMFLAELKECFTEMKKEEEKRYGSKPYLGPKSEKTAK